MVAASGVRYVRGMPTTTSTQVARRVYVLAAHPRWRDSRVNLQLLKAAQAVAHVDVNDLYNRYPDFTIDVEAEQARVAAADLLVMLHPIQWYSMPALQKLWVEEVLSFGWAYGAAGKALEGKDFWLVTTTGGPESSFHPQGYNRYFFDAFLPPYEQTAALCGMRFLPPLVFHGTRSAHDAEVKAHVEVFRDRLSTYPDWPEIGARDASPHRAAPEADRPAEREGA